MRFLRLAFLGLWASVNAESKAGSESRNILKSAFTPPRHFQNVNLLRNINLEKSYPRETINVVIENIDSQPQSHYYLPFEQATISKVGGLEVRDKKQPEKGRFDVDLAEYDPRGSTQYYKVTLPEALKPKDQLTLQITYHTLSSLEPLPTQVEQTEKQYVLYKFSAYAPSAYKTLKQKTKLKLPTSDVPDAVTLPSSLNADGKEDPQKQGTSFTYGPYDEREPGSVEEVSVRYDFTKPLTHSRLLERDIEVSHWGGNIAFEERHWLSNRGATLKNHFSRFTYQQLQYFNPTTHALQSLHFPLQVGSNDAYFIDDIGNVSTSRFRSNTREAILDLTPRYPLYGGWNYSFKVGWNADLQNYLRHVKGARGSYVLKVPFLEGPKQGEGVEYERIVTRIVLPEGAKNLKFETAMPMANNGSIGLHHTFMDTLGRTTLTLTAINTVDEFRDRSVVVTYDYPTSAIFRKPLTIFASVVVVFAVSYLVGTIDTSIGKKKQA